MRIGVIGLGSIGMRHVRNLLEMGEEDVFGCDTRIGEQGFSCAPIQGTNSIDMLWQWKPDAVLICTPPETHHALALHALEHRIPVFCEKPLATNVVYAVELAEMASGVGVPLAIGYQLRWQLDDVPAGVDLTWECSQDMSQWPSRYEKDVLLEFSHEIDAACFINGPVERVVAVQDTYGWALKLRHLDCTSTIFFNPRAKQYARTCHGPIGAVWHFDQQANDRAYKDELNALLAVCQGEPMDARLCTGKQAAHVVKIIQACKRSAEEYEVVKLLSFL